MTRPTNSRTTYLALAMGTAVCGLAVHWWGGHIPPRTRDILGDALWASLIVWLIALTVPFVSPGWRAAAALTFSFLVEFSQLYHHAHVDAIRRTAVGHLVLGTDFDIRDFAAYSLGVIASLLIDRAALRNSAGVAGTARSGT